MQLIPAIDLREGKVVRLNQGDPRRQKVFDTRPAAAAEEFVRCGASLVHVVDLDGAFTGSAGNWEALQEILAVPGVKVELGGGLRTSRAVEKALEAGIYRVVLGTMAIANPEEVGRLASRYGEKIAVGIDAREGRVAVKGWQEESKVDAVELALQMEAYGVPRLIYTDISRDGTLTGPNLKALARMAESVSVPLLASGGVSCLQDILDLRSLEPLGVEGVIVGKALYEGVFSLDEAIKAAGGGV